MIKLFFAIVIEESRALIFAPVGGGVVIVVVVVVDIAGTTHTHTHATDVHAGVEEEVIIIVVEGGIVA